MRIRGICDLVSGLDGLGLVGLGNVESGILGLPLSSRGLGSGEDEGGIRDSESIAQG